MDPQIKPGSLRFFTPFRELEAERIIPLATRVHVRSVRRGERLVSIGDDDPRELFLLAGSVDLSGRDGKVTRLDAGTEPARSPLSPQRPREYQVVARTDIQVVEIEAEVLAILQRLTAADTEVIDSSGVPERWRDLYLELGCALRENRLRLPSLPQVALKVRMALEDDTASAAEIARLIGGDPALAAKLIRVANSALYAGGREVRSCLEAVQRLGMHTSRELVICFSIRDVFKPPSAAVRDRVQSAWGTAVEIGVLCRTLSRHVDRLNPDRGLLAGLLHNIGVVSILQFGLTRPDLCVTHDDLNAAVLALTARVSADILREWKLGDDLVLAAANAKNWGYDGGPVIDYVDLLIVSYLHAHHQRGVQPSRTPFVELPAFRKLQPGELNEKGGVVALAAAANTVRAARQLFG